MQRIAELFSAAAVKRLLGFGIAPLLSMLTPFLLIPVITRVAGPEGWTAVATAQALGTLCGVFAMFGWQIVGPALVAPLEHHRARQTLFVSMVMRLVLFIPAALVGCVVSVLILPAAWTPVAVVLVTAATLTTGLSSGWYFVGIGRARRYLLLEIVPRSAGVLLAAVALIAGADLIVYPVIALASEVAILVLIGAVEARRVPEWARVRREIDEAARRQWHVTGSGLLSQGYTRGAVPIVTAVDLGSAASFSAAERVQGIARTALAPLAQTFQSWVYQGLAQSGTAELRRRATMATWLVLSAGLVAGVAIAVLLPPLGHLLFTSEIPTGWSVSIPTGASVVFIAGSSATSLFFLVPLGRAGVVAQSQAVFAVVGIPLILVTAWVASPALPLVAVAVVELGVFVWQLLAIRRAFRDYRSHPVLDGGEPSVEPIGQDGIV